MKKILLIVVMMLMTVASFGHSRVSETATVVGDTIYQLLSPADDTGRRYP